MADSDDLELFYGPFKIMISVIINLERTVKVALEVDLFTEASLNIIGTAQSASSHNLAMYIVFFVFSLLALNQKYSALILSNNYDGHFFIVYLYFLCRALWYGAFFFIVDFVINGVQVVQGISGVGVISMHVLPVQIYFLYML